MTDNNEERKGIFDELADSIDDRRFKYIYCDGCNQTSTHIKFSDGYGVQMTRCLVCLTYHKVYY